MDNRLPIHGHVQIHHVNKQDMLGERSTTILYVAIHTTSTSDGGNYTCTVTAGGVKASQQFQLNVEGKHRRVMYFFKHMLDMCHTVLMLS